MEDCGWEPAVSVVVKSFPRLHFSLLDLSAAGYRAYGGIGMVVDAVPLTMSFEASSAADMGALASSGYAANEIGKLEATIANAAHISGCEKQPRLTSVKGAMRHFGLGVGTRVALSSIEALFLLNGRTAAPPVLQKLSGRGGASGVGLHGYFEGGLCVDIGRTRSAGKFESSDAQPGPAELPLLACACKVPLWQMHLVIPTAIPAVSQEQEDAYFTVSTPIPEQAVHEAVYTALYGVYGGAASNEYGTFCRALNRLQELPWKQGEVALHGLPLATLLVELRKQGADAVAMSSLGPSVLCVGNLVDPGSLANVCGASVISTQPRNSGREVSVA